MKVALAQTSPVDGDTDANLAAMEALAREHADADLLVLPELWSTGYDLPRVTPLAGQNEHVLREVQRVAQQNDIAIAGSLVMPDVGGGLPRNQGTIVGRDGEVRLRYAKSHLIDAFAEKDYITRGSELPTTEINGVRVALTICYDLRFPELYRYHAERGVDAFIVVAEWPEVRARHWRLLARARAVENLAYVVACNRTGAGGDTVYAGRSMVVDPLGEVLAEGGADTTEVVRGEIVVADVEAARKAFPALDDVWLTSLGPADRAASPGTPDPGTDGGRS